MSHAGTAFRHFDFLQKASLAEAFLFLGERTVGEIGADEKAVGGVFFVFGKERCEGVSIFFKTT